MGIQSLTGRGPPASPIVILTRIPSDLFLQTPLGHEHAQGMRSTGQTLLAYLWLLLRL